MKRMFNTRTASNSVAAILTAAEIAEPTTDRYTPEPPEAPVDEFVRGCRSAGCRTGEVCICDCRACRPHHRKPRMP